MNDKICRKKVKNKNIQIKKKTTNKKKWLIITIIIFIIICLIYGLVLFIDKNSLNNTQHDNSKLHQYEHFINYIENLECNMNKKKYSCNLKDKYEFVSEKYGYDDMNKETRIIFFKIKDSNLIFSVKSSYHCIRNLDASCDKYIYQLSDNFKKTAFQYYIEEYNQLIGYHNQYCHQFTDYCINGLFDIKTNTDLEYVIDYMNGFLDYINKLDFKFIDEYEFFDLRFEKTYKNGINYGLSIYFDIKDDNYTYKFKDEYMPTDNKIETYINNYLTIEDISL